MPKQRDLDRVPALMPEGPLQAAIGAMFKAKRKAARPKISLSDLAARLGCSINTIRWHEAGTRMMRVDDIMRSAEIIGCPAGDLLPADSAAPAKGGDDD